MYTLKKSLGQHFLKDENVTAKIVGVLQEEKFSRLLEVGPGGGALTKELIKLSGIDFLAAEIDDEKISFLMDTFPVLRDRIIRGDFLESDAPFEEPFVVIGNFPYNISTQILFKILDWKDRVPVVIGMFQKEVAERVVAGPGSKTYGVLSALLQPFYEAEYLFDVPPESFRPPPKVVSAVIRLRRKENVLAVRSDRSYRILVKTAFQQRRKTLRNAVRSLFLPAELTDPIFDRRAEQLSIEEFAALTFRMN